MVSNKHRGTLLLQQVLNFKIKNDPENKKIMSQKNSQMRKSLTIMI